MNRPLVVYDGLCKFCQRQMDRLVRWVGNRFDVESFRTPDFFKRHPEFTLEECEKAIQFVSPQGVRYSGAEAVARILALRTIFLPVLWIYYVPGIRMIWDWLYRNISLNRYRISRWKLGI